MKYFNILALLLLISTSFSFANEGKKPKKMNVLLIVVDDLRPDLNCYGNSQIVSPNIDKLAKEGTLFNRAYCNVPVCGASRASLLTGLRPLKDRFVKVSARIDKQAKGITTLPKLFKDQGYYTIQNGKIMHGKKDAKGSWDEEYWGDSNSASFKDYIEKSNQAFDAQKKCGNSTENLDVADNAYRDGRNAEKTIEDLRKLKKSGKPFFVAMGISKPHLPFTAPKKYWDLYKREDIKLPDNNVFDKEEFPKAAYHSWGELRKYQDIPNKGDIADDKAKELKHGYYACVSYADALVGKVLKELKRLKLDKNTIVVLTSDHGWSLEEHGLWCKHSSFHNALEIPLIVKMPNQYKNQKTENIVELVDLYPTVCELSGMKLPEHLQGDSFVEAMKAPKKDFKRTAVCKWQTGLTLVEGNHTYTEWFRGGKIAGQMMFDHSQDPEENHNLINDKKNKGKADEMHKKLYELVGQNFWKSAK